MGLIQDLLGKMKENKSEFKEQLKQAQINDKIENTINERKKSSNRRELERYMKEQEEIKIKQALDRINKKRNSETWKSKNLILGQKTTILKDDRPILKEKNIFMDNRNKVPLQNKREGMFLRW